MVDITAEEHVKAFKGIPTKEVALEYLEDLDDFCKMEVSVNPEGQYTALKRFIEHYGE